jgi:hypothetical protein
VKGLFIIGLLFCSAFAFTVDVQPNFVRAVPGESFQVKAVILPDANGFYSLQVEGCGISFSRNYELLVGQTFEVPLTATAPNDTGTYEISAVSSLEGVSATGKATVKVVGSSEETGDVNATLIQARSDLDALVRRAQAVSDEQAGALLVRADLLLNQSNSSYELGYLMAAQSSMDEAQSLMEKAEALIQLSEKGRWGVNLNLLLAGVVIVLIAVVLSKYMKV